jgi:hypothetical protein
MDIWAGIKHALNSTLGTEDFKPLDKLLKHYLEEHKSLAPSDSIYKVIQSGERYKEVPSSTISYTIIGGFTSNVTGAIRILAELKAELSSYTGSSYLYVLKGDSVDYTDSGGHTLTNSVARMVASSEDYVTKSVDINIIKGQRYSFALGNGKTGTYSNITCSKIRIGAYVIDGSLIS